MKELELNEIEKIQAGSLPCGTIMPHGLGWVGAASVVLGLIRGSDCSDEVTGATAGSAGGGASGGAG